MFSCDLMPRPTATIRSACDRSTACLASWNGASAFCRTTLASMRDGGGGDRRGRAPLLHGVGAEGADLHRDEVRRRSIEDHVGDQLALEHRARERRLSVRLAHRDDIGDERAIEARRQRRREVAGLVGVRQHHERRRLLRHQRRGRVHERIRRVEAEQRVLDRDDFGHRGRRQLAGDAGDRLAEHRNLHRQAAAGQLLRGGHGLPARAIELAVLLFRND